MKFTEDAKLSAQYLRKAIPLMVERHIPPTPYNYALWYAHVKEESPELSEKLLQAFPNKGSYDREKSENLFYDFFVKEYLPQSPEAQDALAGLLSHLFGAVNKIEGGAREYSDNLQLAATTLDAADDQEEIQQVLSKLLEDTATVESASRAFQSELDQARAEIETLREELKSTQQQARIDELTQISNRRAFDQAMRQSLDDTAKATCLILLDLDHFKKCNDTYGHVMGDKVLERMGQILTGFEQDGVMPARYGGEEFAIVFDGQRSRAQELAEMIRQKVATIRITQKGSGKVIDAISVSIGIAEAVADETPKSLKVRADEALYTAKANGRDQVVCA